jgi:hypothetical protein
MTTTTPSQTSRILGHMARHGSITPIEALNLYGCFRLAARVSDLRRSGHDIQTTLVVKTETGERYARYQFGQGEK